MFRACQRKRVKLNDFDPFEFDDGFFESDFDFSSSFLFDLVSANSSISGDIIPSSESGYIFSNYFGNGNKTSEVVGENEEGPSINLVYKESAVAGNDKMLTNEDGEAEGYNIYSTETQNNYFESHNVKIDNENSSNTAIDENVINESAESFGQTPAESENQENGDNESTENLHIEKIEGHNVKVGNESYNNTAIDEYVVNESAGSSGQTLAKSENQENGVNESTENLHTEKIDPVDVGILEKYTNFFTEQNVSSCPGSDTCWERAPDRDGCRMIENEKCYTTVFSTDKMTGKANIFIIPYN